MPRRGTRRTGSWASSAHTLASVAVASAAAMVRSATRIWHDIAAAFGSPTSVMTCRNAALTPPGR